MKVQELQMQVNQLLEQEQSKDLAHFALYVKDKFSLSDAAYQEISQLTNAIPRLKSLKSLSKNLNSGSFLMLEISSSFHINPS